MDIVSVQAAVRRRDFFFEPCAVIFEYEDPEVLGTMDVSYAPEMWLRSNYYGADEFFEVQGDKGFVWVTRCTGQLLDLPSVVLYDGTKGQQTTTAFPHLDDDWAAGFRRSSEHFIDALVDGTPAEMSAAEAIKALQLCFAVYEAGNTRLPVDPRSITDRVVPEGWPS
jgi:predicted dehydrogenase